MPNALTGAMSANPYETDRLLGEYLLFHYGRSEEILPYGFGPSDALDFPARVVRECFDAAALGANRRALDLGCAVGRSSFELARHCGEVIGIDFSQNFIRAAETLRDQGQLDYQRIEEGRLSTTCTAHLPEGVDVERMHFETGDACHLRDHLGAFDAVLLANLIDRLSDPRRCLERLPGLLNPGGQLVIASPFTWLEEYTPLQNWLGGFERDGRCVETFQALRDILDKDFAFVRAVDLPFLIREHARKFQWSISRAGLWRRR
jgi:putative 4-mercaptohistidine N1-methyltranferase